MWGISAKSQISNPHGFEYITSISNLDLFFDLFLMILNEILFIFHENMKSRRRGISWHQFRRRNFRKSLNMNFISIKKHETISSNFGQGNPYHQSTYRFPPLHPISAPDANSFNSLHLLVNGTDQCKLMPKNLHFFEKTFHVFWSKLNSYLSFARNSAGKIDPKRFLVLDFSCFHENK